MHNHPLRYTRYTSDAQSSLEIHLLYQRYTIIPWDTTAIPVMHNHPLRYTRYTSDTPSSFDLLYTRYPRAIPKYKMLIQSCANLLWKSHSKKCLSYSCTALSLCNIQYNRNLYHSQCVYTEPFMVGPGSVGTGWALPMEGNVRDHLIFNVLHSRSF